MNCVLAKVKGKRKKPFSKLISNQALFPATRINPSSCVLYSPDHNLDEDSWFKIEDFSQKPFCIGIISSDFDSKDYDDLLREQFQDISYLFSVQDGNFFFQKVTPSLFIKRKAVVFLGEAAELEEGNNRLVISAEPDAIYFKQLDVLIFRSLATISSIFKGIDELFKEATNEDVERFLAEPFIEVKDGYDTAKVSKLNRKRIGLAMATLEAMPIDERRSMFSYIDDYTKQKDLIFNQKSQKFEIATDEQLKILLYGIEQRFYTTPFSQERRLANSVQAIDS